MNQNEPREMMKLDSEVYIPILNDLINEIEMMKLDSEVYIPILNDLINEIEMKTAVMDMQKAAGYDYNLPVLTLLVVVSRC